LANDLMPRYLETHRRGELRGRIEDSLRMLGACRLCPRECQANRLGDEPGTCRAGRLARVASHFAHMGEECCLSGTGGSGTIFFSWCNLQCVFCQNASISREPAGRQVNPQELAGMMLEFQDRGCHNINLVTPTHVIPQILESLPLAIDGGLRVPIVYNTSAFDSVTALRLLDGVVDIYMPDFKYWFDARAATYLTTAQYPGAARAGIREMHRQVGDLVIDERGLARRGLLVRHLVMPGALDDTREIMVFLAEQISRDTFVNIMGQYRPGGLVGPTAYAEINRAPTAEELAEAYAAARAAGLHRFEG